MRVLPCSSALAPFAGVRKDITARPLHVSLHVDYPVLENAYFVFFDAETNQDLLRCLGRCRGRLELPETATAIRRAFTTVDYLLFVYWGHWRGASEMR
ncbi:hypothetical protein EVG20_g4745 [Dentipellis fragilis]|uniref:Uncharacterized protein n=1 Tax=Dentipellis fragilis TaxID=205917 RepID=A0A4Y9YVV1_9AGAM|nr:hypothetical protein EVG20_g4745 [Dentipellis fragilis]